MSPPRLARRRVHSKNRRPNEHHDWGGNCLCWLPVNLRKCRSLYDSSPTIGCWNKVSATLFLNSTNFTMPKAPVDTPLKGTMKNKCAKLDLFGTTISD